MHVTLVIGLCCFRFSYFCSDFTKWCRGDRSHTSLVPIACRSVARPAILPCLPLMASWTMSMGDLVVVTLGSPWPVVAPIPRVLGAGGALLGNIDVEVVGASPQLGDDAGSLLWNLMMRGASVPRNSTPGDAAPTPGSSGVAGPRVLSCTWRARPAFLSCPLTRGGWGTRQSLRIHGSPP
jgi:hypothetical protein